MPQRELRTRAPTNPIFTPMSAPPVQISRTFLLAIYSIIPISFAVALVDLLFFHGLLKSKLPSSPEGLLLFAIFFNLPHIVASSVCFLDTEYLKHFRARIFLPVAAVAAGMVIFPNVIFSPVFTAILYLWTVIHVIGQQFGMIRLMGKAPHRLLDPWKWSAIAMGAMIYFGTYVPGSQFGQTNAWLHHQTLIGAWTLAVPFSILGAVIYRATDAGIARRSVAANFAMMLSIVVLYQLGYSFFLILIPRIIHDLSAFVFYSVHDLNRNRFGAKNWIYKSFVTLGVPMRLLSPAAAIAIAFPLTYYFLHESLWAYRIAVSVTLIHYYTDRFVWKNGSPLRNSIYLGS